MFAVLGIQIQLVFIKLSLRIKLRRRLFFKLEV